METYKMSDREFFVDEKNDVYEKLEDGCTDYFCKLGNRSLEKAVKDILRIERDTQENPEPERDSEEYNRIMHRY